MGDTIKVVTVIHDFEDDEYIVTSELDGDVCVVHISQPKTHEVTTIRMSRREQLALGYALLGTYK